MDAQTEQKAFSWLKQIPGDLFILDEKPLLGTPPPFAWQEFNAQLSAVLQIERLTIKPGEWMWRSTQELFDGLGKNLRGMPLSMQPLSGSLWWVMPEKGLLQLVQAIVHKKEDLTNEEIDHEFLKTFYRFLAIEVLNTFDKVNADKKMAAHLARDEGMPDEVCLCLDVSVGIQDKIFYGRLFLSKEFQKTWRQRYLQPESEVILSSSMADSLDVIVHLEAGKIALKPSEWKTIAVGDFLFLDQCSLNLEQDNSRVMLVINEQPFFRGKLKQGTLKILEHPLHYEVHSTMDQTNQDSNSGHTDEDIDFGDEFDSTNEDLSLSSQEHTTTEETNVSAEISLDEETTTKEDETATHIAASNKPPTSTSLEDIPLPIVIELGRIQMSIKKLLELQPGNMMDLDIHPEAGVDLVVHGKRIAKGEVLRIGDSLGVRILELY